MPTLDSAIKAVTVESHWPSFKGMEGKPFPAEVIRKATDEIEEFCRILKHEGVIVRRPELIDYQQGYSTPDFESTSGFYGAMPRLVYTCILNVYINIDSTPGLA